MQRPKEPTLLLIIWQLNAMAQDLPSVTNFRARCLLREAIYAGLDGRFVSWSVCMTSLAGAISVGNTEELLESLYDRGPRAKVQDEVYARSPFTQRTLDKPEVVHFRLPRTARKAVPVVRDNTLYLVGKRLLDIVGSAVGLLVFSPFVAVLAVITKVTDGGSIFYRHTRIGKCGREFQCLKFRTMVMNADSIKADIAHLNTHDDHRTFKVPNDPRVTRLGRWLRRASLDEVPQLWNVLKGDMSLVGPRPPVPQEVERYDLDDMQRLMVTPGLTCIWQVSGRSRLPFPEQLAMDIAYIEKRSFWLDLKLIALTVPAVLSADGAY